MTTSTPPTTALVISNDVTTTESRDSGVNTLAATLHEGTRQTERAAGSPVYARRPIILDGQALLSATPAIYIPTVIQFKTGDIAVGEFSKTFTADAKMTGHHQVAITPTASARGLYYDATTEDLIYADPSTIPIDASRYHHLITTFGTGNSRGQGYTSNFLVHDVEDSGASVYATNGNYLAFDRIARKLYVPDMEGITTAAGAWEMQSEQGFFGHRVVDIPESDFWQVWVDTNAIAVDGNRDPSALVFTTHTGMTGADLANSSGHAGMLLLASGQGENIMVAAPFELAETVRNEFAFGKRDFALQRLYFSTAEIATLTDPDLTGMGFTDGIRSTADPHTVFAGGPLKHGGGKCFVSYRFYIQSDVADEFGTPRVYMRYIEDTGTAIGRPLYDYMDVTQYREISSTVREYYGVVELDATEDYGGFLVGGAFGTNDCIVTGIQYAQSMHPATWIGVDDYPNRGETIESRIDEIETIIGAPALAADFVLPPHIYTVEGQGFSLFPDQMSRQTKHGSLRFSIQDDPSGTDVPVGITTYGDSVVFDDRFNGGSVDMFLNDLSLNTEQATYRNVPVTRVTTAAVGGLPAIKVASIGDSLTEVYVFAHIMAQLNTLGVTATTIGTITQTSAVTGDADVLGEGRGGTSLGDTIYYKTGEMEPPASPAAYLAASVSERKDLNPFIRVSTGGDAASVINNGYVFDYGYYLTNFVGGEIPDVVYIAHGYNDVTDEYNDADAINEIYGVGLENVLNSVRAAAPSALIVVAFYAIGRFANNARHDQNQWTAMQAELETIAAVGDSNTIFVPGYCTMSRDATFQYTSGTADRTGTVNVERDDYTHPSERGTRTFGAVAAQFIAGKLAS